MRSSSSSNEGAHGAICRRWPFLAHLASLAAMLVVWQAIASFFPPSLLPGPIPVFKRVWEILISGKFAFHMAQTLLRVGVGFLLAFW